MARLFEDTHPAIEAMLIAGLREMPVSRRWTNVRQLNVMVRTLAISNLRQMYPSASQTELHRRLADRLLGPELAGKVYGPLIETEMRDG